MKNHILIAGAVVAALAIPFAADAQSGATTGAAGSVKGFVQDIKGLAVKNNEFRRVLYTAKNLQLVAMALKPKEEIEVHKLDQFLRVEVGTGEAVLDGVRTPIREGFAVVVPAGVNHNIGDRNRSASSRNRG